MPRRLHLVVMAAAALAAPAAASAQEVVGAWNGVLVAGPNLLRIVLRLKASGDGKYEGELVSPDQSPKGIAVGEVKLDGDKLSFTVPQIAGAYEGRWDAAKTAWVGAWKQGPASLPLTLAKGEIPPPGGAAAQNAAGAAGASPPPARPPSGPAATPPPAGARGSTVAGVTVQGQSQGVRADIDRRSYDITRDLQTQAGGSIADALRNIPSVQVDVQGNLSVRGDPNVTIMIDGKPSSLFQGPSRGQVLQNLPANAFERVEVLTNPSAAFRPDGSGGIINLIPKQARQVGRTGSVRVTGGTGGRGQVAANLSSVGKKLTVTADATFGHDDQPITQRDRRATLDPLSGGFLNSTQDTTAEQKVNIFVGRLGFDYDPDRKTRISGELRDTSIRVKSDTFTVYTGLGPSGLTAFDYDRDARMRLQRDNLAANASWRRKFGTDPDHELVADLTQEHNIDRLNLRATYVYRVPAGPNRAEDIRQDTDVDVTHLKVDYTRPTAGDGKLKTGYELEYNRTLFDNFGLSGVVLAPDPNFTDEFRVNQAVNGAYVTFQHPVGRMSVLAGLRVEDTQIDLKDSTTGFRGANNYTRFYPSLHLSWKLDNARQLKASYSERIARPALSDYNPFRVYQGPFNYRAGNPDLKPQQTHSFELAYEYRKGFTNYLGTLYWRENEKGVTDVVRDIGGGVLLTTRENLSRSRNGGLELSANGRIGKKLTYGISGDAFWNQIDASALGFPDKRSAWTLSARGALTWQATAKDQFQLIGQLTGTRLTPQGHHEPLGLLFAGYRHKFNNDWALTVSARDLLGSYKDVNVIDTPTLRDRIETDVKLRAVFVGVTYSFGAGARKDTGIDYGTSTAGAAGAR